MPRFLDFDASVPGFAGSGTGGIGPVGWQNMYEMDMGHFTNPNFSVAVAKFWYFGLAVPDRTSKCLCA